MNTRRIEKKLFGNTESGEAVFIYTLHNSKGSQLDIIDFGGAVVSLKVPDINGRLTDVVLGYDKFNEYERQGKYIGALIGRCGNRIAKGRFSLNKKLNEKEYTLYCNDGNNHLHGGKSGFDKKLWKSENNSLLNNSLLSNSSLKLTYLSPDGEEGYPGNLQVTVIYTLSDDNELIIEYSATSDMDTVCNLTNHTYFNLAGCTSGLINSQKIQLFADSYTEADRELLPTGVIADVVGTPMDLREPTVIGEHIDDDFLQLRLAGGYDHNWVIRDYDGSLKHGAFACDDSTGITMDVYTTLPGIQFYSGNFLDGAAKGKGNAPYDKRWGFCLETQYFPNALEHSNFLQPILKKGELYHSVTKYCFGTI